MSLQDYNASLVLSGSNYSFSAFIMAAIQKGTHQQRMIIYKYFPDIYSEYWRRLNSLDGRLTSDPV